MADSKIEWTDKTWNPITGCTQISEGCKNCYAKRVAETRLKGRFGYPQDNSFRPGIIHKDKLLEPLKWKKPCRIFVCSMGDLFHEDVPFSAIDNVFAMAWLMREHTFMLLTKRPGRMKDYINRLLAREDSIAETILTKIKRMGAFTYSACGHTTWPWPNVWLGTTVELQKYEYRICELLEIPAAVRYVSIEPMLGPINLRDSNFMKIPLAPLDQKYRYDYLTGVSGIGNQNKYDHKGKHLDWVICGAESGPGARPMQYKWAVNLKDQCQSTGIPFFYKQGPSDYGIRSVKMPQLHIRVWDQLPNI